MKICMLTWEFPPRIVGGIARHCFGLGKALVAEGYDVHVVTLDFPGAPMYEEIEGLKVHRVKIELGHPHFITWTFLLNHFLEKKVAMLNSDVHFDIIHIHDWLTGTAGINSKYYLNKPLVSTVHSTEIGRTQGLHSPDSYLIDSLEWWIIYEAKKVIICSNSMKTKLEGHFHVPPEKNLVIPNAIDISKYKRTINRNAVKKRYNLHSDDKLVLYIGRLVPQKGVEYLIQATPQLLQNNNNLHIFIIGDGWSRTSLETLANSTVHGNKIRFLGFIPDSEVVNLFLVADVLVIPSIYEPFGIVALEGMAAGVPVVAANVGGLAEIIDHDQTGVLVYVENPDSIAWGVNKVISNPEYSRRLIQNAKKKVQKEYSWSAVAKKTIKIYKEIYEG